MGGPRIVTFKPDPEMQLAKSEDALEMYLLESHRTDLSRAERLSITRSIKFYKETIKKLKKTIEKTAK